MRNTIVRWIRSMSKRSGPKQTNVSNSWARNEGEISNNATTAGHMSKRSCKTQSNCKGTSEVCQKGQASEAIINRSSKIITVNTSQAYFIASSPNPCGKRSNSWVHQILLAKAPERRHGPTKVMTQTANCEWWRSVVEYIHLLYISSWNC